MSILVALIPAVFFFVGLVVMMRNERGPCTATRAP